ncbi:zinc finger protein 724-like [Ctenocephalides felis]|uniref:zinc finger protein 724-like n=1 Tax=Ctenocephalides felis TaxID=7515 RepID=UPI000E6E31EE|nr:zinc finger protein 724-like [Ctenocephalides felis]
MSQNAVIYPSVDKIKEEPIDYVEEMEVTLEDFKEIKSEPNLEDDEICLNRFLKSEVTVEEEIKPQLDNQEEQKSINKSAQLDTKYHSCKICFKAFKLRSNLDKHMFDDIGNESFKCNYCDMLFMSAIDLMTHLKDHPDDSPLKCEVCSVGFSDIDMLTQHMQSHTKEPPYKCEFCDKGFTNLTKFEDHLIMHSGERRYKCDLCNKLFKHAGSFRRHCLAHTDLPHKCEICKQAFTERYELVNHLKQQHNDDISVRAQISFDTPSHPYKCETCGKSFKQPGGLKHHKFIHTGEKCLNAVYVIRLSDK